MDKVKLLKSKLQALKLAGQKDSDPDVMSLKMQISELEALKRTLVPTITGSKTVLLGSAPSQKLTPNKYMLLGSIATLVIVGYLVFKKS